MGRLIYETCAALFCGPVVGNQQLPWDLLAGNLLLEKAGSLSHQPGLSSPDRWGWPWAEGHPVPLLLSQQTVEAAGFRDLAHP